MHPKRIDGRGNAFKAYGAKCVEFMERKFVVEVTYRLEIHSRSRFLSTQPTTPSFYSGPSASENMDKKAPRTHAVVALVRIDYQDSC